MGIWNAKSNIRRLWRLRRPRRPDNRHGSRVGMHRLTGTMRRGDAFRFMVGMRESDRRDGILVRAPGFYLLPEYGRARS